MNLQNLKYACLIRMIDVTKYVLTNNYNDFIIGREVQSPDLLHLTYKIFQNISYTAKGQICFTQIFDAFMKFKKFQK